MNNNTPTPPYFLHPAYLEEVHRAIGKVRDSLSRLISITPPVDDMRGAKDVLVMVDTTLGELNVMLESADFSVHLILAEPLREHLCSRLSVLACVIGILPPAMEFTYQLVLPVGFGETMNLLGDKLRNLASLLCIVKIDEGWGLVS